MYTLVSTMEIKEGDILVSTLADSTHCIQIKTLTTGGSLGEPEYGVYYYILPFKDNLEMGHWKDIGWSYLHGIEKLYTKNHNITPEKFRMLYKVYWNVYPEEIKL